MPLPPLQHLSTRENGRNSAAVKVEMLRSPLPLSRPNAGEARPPGSTKCENQTHFAPALLILLLGNPKLSTMIIRDADILLYVVFLQLPEHR